MKRRTLNEFDSLDLLLDTICDTFGGVVFVAVLVAILTSRVGETIEASRTADTTNDAAKSLQQAALDKRAELQSLQRALREQLNTMSNFQAEQPTAQVEEIVTLRREVADLLQDRVQIVQDTAEINKELDIFELRRQNLRNSLEQSMNEESSLNQQLQKEKASRHRTLALPMLRQTTKREFPVILRFGHLYFPFIAETGLATRKSNLDDFVIIDDKGPAIRATPKPYAGTHVTNRDELIDEIRRRTSSLNKNEVYLAIGVWEDSFEQFQQLKEVIVKLGFEYRLVPIAAGEFIQESQVKETLVQ